MAAFVDTNIFVYALSSVNEGETEKVATARRLIAELMREGSLVLSAQVLSEFIVVAMRKTKTSLAASDLWKALETLLSHTVVPVDADLVQRAVRRMQESRSYWDAQIVEAAIRSGASILYTEDLHSGTVYDGVEIRNPFLQV